MADEVVTGWARVGLLGGGVSSFDMGDDGDMEGGPNMSLPSLGVGDGGVIGRPGFKTGFNVGAIGGGGKDVLYKTPEIKFGNGGGASSVGGGRGGGGSDVIGGIRTAAGCGSGKLGIMGGVGGGGRGGNTGLGECVGVELPLVDGV